MPDTGGHQTCARERQRVPSIVMIRQFQEKLSWTRTESEEVRLHEQKPKQAEHGAALRYERSSVDADVPLHRPPVRLRALFKSVPAVPWRVSEPINIGSFHGSCFRARSPNSTLCRDSVTTVLPQNCSPIAGAFQERAGGAMARLRTHKHWLFSRFVFSRAFTEFHAVPRLCYHCVTTELQSEGRLAAERPLPHGLLAHGTKRWGLESTCARGGSWA